MKNILFVILVAFGLSASAQQVNPVPDYTFANRMSAGRNTVTDTAAYFSIGPRYGAIRGMMPPMVVDTAAVSGNKRNGLLIFSVQKNKFLYWDSVGVKWAEMAGTGGSAITGTGVAGYLPEFTTTTNLDSTSLYHSAGRFAIGSTTTSNGRFSVFGGQSYFDTSLKVGSQTLLADEGKNEVYVNTTGDSGSYAFQVNGSMFTNSNITIRSNAPALFISDVDGASEHLIQGDNNSLLLYADRLNSQSNSAIKMFVDGTEYATLNSSGYLGVGNTTPGTRLEVAESNSGAIAKALQVKNYAFPLAANGDGVQIGFANNRNWASDNASTITSVTTNFNNGATALYFSTWSGSSLIEGFRLNSSQELLIGNNPTDAGAFALQVTGAIYNTTTITTGAPTSGTAKPWRLGEAATVSPTSPNRTIRVEIDGTVYYLHAKTTND